MANAYEGGAGGAAGRSLTDRAYDAMKRQILLGDIPPGGHIDSARMATDLAMSRTPVREALLRLQNEGVIEILPRRGLRIVPFSAEDLQELYQVITALEVEAVDALCARRPGRDELTPLFQAVADMTAGVDAGDGEAWNLADERFHRGLLALCGNARLCKAGLSYRDLAQRAHFVALRLVSLERKQRSIDAHGRLIDAILAGDVGRVRAEHHAQRIRGGELLVNVLREHRLSHL